MDNYEITFKPANCKVYASEGSTLKDAIVKSGLDFDFPCGGIGKCGKCVIKVLEPKLKVLKKEVEHFSENELSALSLSYKNPQQYDCRIKCQKKCRL